MKRLVQPFGNGVVQLRPVAEGDLEMTLAWRNRDDARVWFKTSQIISLEQHRAWFHRYRERDDDFLFIVEANGRPAGQAAVYAIDWPKGTGEVGRFLAAPDARGQGYIGMACGELLEFCASVLHLKSVFLEVKENNHRAIEIYRRNGFREEAREEGIVRMVRPLVRAVGR